MTIKDKSEFSYGTRGAWEFLARVVSDFANCALASFKNSYSSINLIPEISEEKIIPSIFSSTKEQYMDSIARNAERDTNLFRIIPYNDDLDQAEADDSIENQPTIAEQMGPYFPEILALAVRVGVAIQNQLSSDTLSDSQRQIVADPTDFIANMPLQVAESIVNQGQVLEWRYTIYMQYIASFVGININLNGWPVIDDQENNLPFISITYPPTINPVFVSALRQRIETMRSEGEEEILAGNQGQGEISFALVDRYEQIMRNPEILNLLQQQMLPDLLSGIVPSEEIDQ